MDFNLKDVIYVIGFIMVIIGQVANYIKSDTIQNNELKHIGIDIKEIRNKQEKFSEKLEDQSKKVAVLEDRIKE